LSWSSITWALRRSSSTRCSELCARIDQRAVDRDHLVPRARLAGQRDQDVAGLLAIGRPRERRERISDRGLGVIEAILEDLGAAQIELDSLGGVAAPSATSKASSTAFHDVR